jgi:hypothetical protein
MPLSTRIPWRPSLAPGDDVDAPDRRRPMRGLALAGVAVLLVVAVGAWVGLSLLRDGEATGPLSSAADGSDDAGIERRLPPLGVFGETDADRIRAFEERLGVTAGYAVDFSSRETWQEISRPDYMISEWKDAGYRPVYGIAMLPESEEASMAEGARGSYDRYFVDLGRRLVAGGQEDAVLRVGWEFNLEGSAWNTDDPEEFVRYWRRIAAALKSVPGQRFALDWNVNNGTGGDDPVRYYPGDDVVDYVGVDVYDVAGDRGTYPYGSDCDAGCRTERQERAWRRQIFGGERGLRFWTLFAAEHGKPVSVPEWGLWEGADADGGGDNPVFIRRMYEFLSNPRNNVAYHAYFDNDSGGRKHRLSNENFPQAQEAFRDLFGDDADQP